MYPGALGFATPDGCSGLKVITGYGILSPTKKVWGPLEKYDKIRWKTVCGENFSVKNYCEIIGMQGQE